LASAAKNSVIVGTAIALPALNWSSRANMPAKRFVNSGIAFSSLA